MDGRKHPKAARWRKSDGSKSITRTEKPWKEEESISGRTDRFVEEHRRYPIGDEARAVILGPRKRADPRV